MPLPGLHRRAFLIAGGACALALDTRADAPSRPPLALGRDAPPDIDPRAYLVSEKLDGVRAWWDGQRLRFRSGLPIVAPRRFTDRLPATPLDGELWLGRGHFEATSGLVRRVEPDIAGWQALRYAVFDIPGGRGPFRERAATLADIARRVAWPQLLAVEQVALADAAALQRRLDAVLAAGGEGLMLHHAEAPHVAGRSPWLLKLKPWQDAEAVVIGHLPGRGRHAGRLGALAVQAPDGRRFRLGTGLTDAQRDDPPAIGSTVSYRYRGLTEDGLPRFASFWRVRAD